MDAKRSFMLLFSSLLLLSSNAFQMIPLSSKIRFHSLPRYHPRPSSSCTTLLHNANNDRKLSCHYLFSDHYAAKYTINNNTNKKVQKYAIPTSLLVKSLQEMVASAGIVIPTLLLALTLIFLSVPPQPANAAPESAGGATITSRAVINSVALEDWRGFAPQRQWQYFDGLFSSRENLAEDATEAKLDPVALVTKERFGMEHYGMLVEGKEMERGFLMQPNYVNFGCAFIASCVSTVIVHPLDTIKVRLMSEKGATVTGDCQCYEVTGVVNSPKPEQNGNTAALFSLTSLYDGIGANIAKEAPASALYLGIYESAKAFLSTVPFFREHVLLNYLLAGSVGEFVGSMARSPAEAVKTRVQTGQYDVTGAIQCVFLTREGRKNTFDAWVAGLLRDVPHGAIQIAVFELSKIWIVNSAVIDVDVNTLFSEAILGGFGGGLGAFVSTPSDVVVVNVMTSMSDGRGVESPLQVLARIWNEDGVNGLFSGFAERVSYWAIAVGIFLSVYCSLRQYYLALS